MAAVSANKLELLQIADAVAREKSIDRSIVIGSSMGGMVALQYALAYPERTSALALLNTGPDLMSETPWGKRFAALVGEARAKGDRALSRWSRRSRSSCASR